MVVVSILHHADFWQFMREGFLKFYLKQWYQLGGRGELGELKIWSQLVILLTSWWYFWCAGNGKRISPTVISNCHLGFNIWDIAVLPPGRKVGCVFLMVSVPMLPHAELGLNDRREYALHFTHYENDVHDHHDCANERFEWKQQLQFQQEQ